MSTPYMSTPYMSTPAHEQDGRSPLCWACKKGHYEIIMMLLDGKADVNMSDKV